MQKIKFDVFKTLFSKNLTACEVDFILALAQVQNERGRVYGMHYAEMVDLTGMSIQTFYNCLSSLEKKEIIKVTHQNGDYDIRIIGNDFSLFSEKDYKNGKVKYININNGMINSQNFKLLKAKQKLLALQLCNINSASLQKTHKIKKSNFYGTYTKLLGVSQRTLRKYLKMLQLFFRIDEKNGSLGFTLRDFFRTKKSEKTENQITYERLIDMECRRLKIKEDGRKEEAQILQILLNCRKKYVKKAVDLPAVFEKMIKTINKNKTNRKKWQRYLKGTLFAKLLKEAYTDARTTSTEVRTKEAIQRVIDQIEADGGAMCIG